MFRKIINILCCFLLVVSMTGCTREVINAIDNKDMTVIVNMTDTIFLDAEKLATNKNVYVRTMNTSDMQSIDFQNLLVQQLTNRGMHVVADPRDAEFRVQANVLAMSREKQSLTADGALAGGFGGGLAGIAVGRGSGEVGIGMGVGGLLGAGAGALAGSMVHVDQFFGAIDVQIEEKMDRPVSGVVETHAGQGSASVLHTTSDVSTNWQTFRTRMVARAKQTNIDENEAAHAISAKLAMQISNLF